MSNSIIQELDDIALEYVIMSEIIDVRNIENGMYKNFYYFDLLQLTNNIRQKIRFLENRSRTNRQDLWDRLKEVE